MATRKADGITRNIRDELRNAGLVGTRHVTGLAKLFLASGRDYFTANAPATVGMVQANDELIKDTVKFLRNPADAINKQIDRAFGSENFKALQQFAGTALNDLKTGNFYDEDRFRGATADAMDDLMKDFGGFDMTGFDEDGNWSGDNIEGGVSDQEVALVEIQEANADRRTKATIDAMTNTATAMIHTQRSDAQANLRTQIKQHGQQMAALQNMITAQTATFELMNKGIQAQLDVTREAHNQIMGALDTTNKILGEIRDAVKPPKTTRKEYRPNEEIFGVNGEINIAQYFKKVFKNVDEKFNLKSTMSTLTMGQSIPELLEMFMSNPWQLVSDQIVKSALPKNFQDALKRTDKNIGSFFPALFQSWYDRGRRFESGAEEGSMFDMLAGLFGVNQRSRSTLDTRRENYLAPAVFTGKFTRAVEEVIPMWLARIDSHISGEPMMIYNYATGKLDQVAGVIASTSKDLKDLAGRMGDTRSEIMDRARRAKPMSPKEEKEFNDYLYRALQRTGEDNLFVNPWSKEYQDVLREMAGSNKHRAEALIGILQSMPRDKLMSVSRDIMDARNARDQNTYRKQGEYEDNGLIAALSGFFDEGMASSISYKARNSADNLSQVELTNIINNSKSKTLLNGGAKATNMILSDILSTLRKGIITFSYGMGELTDESVQQVYKAVTKTSREQYSSESKLAADLDNMIKRINQTDESSEAEATRRKNNMTSRGAVGPKDLYLTEHMTADTMLQLQAAFDLAEMEPGEINNPTVSGYGKLAEREKEKAKARMERISKATGLDKTKLIFQESMRAPFDFMTKTFEFTDNFMFRILYGRDAPSYDGENDNAGLMDIITDSLHVQLKTAKDWFVENVGGPLKDYFMGENGLLPRIADQINKMFVEPAKKKVGDKFNEVKKKFTGSYDEETKTWSGGRFSDQLNKMGAIKNATGDQLKTQMTSAIDRFLYGDYASGHGVKTVTELKQEGDRFVGYNHKEYGGAIGQLRKGFDSVKEFFFGSEGEDNDSKRKWNLVTGEIKEAFPNMVINGGIGMVASLFLPGGPLLGGLIGSAVGLVQGSDKLKNYLFGEPIEDEKYQEYDIKTGKMVEKTRKGRKGGLINKSVYDSFKKYMPGLSKGALAGAVAGGLGILPFGIGPMVGSIMGALGGTASASDKFKEMIFGKADDDESGLISRNFRKRFMEHIKKHAPASIVGGAGGMAVGSLVSSFGILPGLSFGPILGALGAIAGYANADNFNKFLFGEETEEEVDDGKGGKVKKKVRKGGVFGSMFDFAKNRIIEPAGEKINEIGAKIGNWFQEGVLTPLGNAMQPFKDQMSEAGNRIHESLKNIGEHITESIRSVFDFHVGQPLGEWWKEHVSDRLKQVSDRIFDTIGKVLGTVLSAPFKAFEYIVTGKNAGSDEDLEEDGTKKGFFSSIFGDWGVNAKRRREKRVARNAAIRKRNRQKRGSSGGWNFNDFGQVADWDDITSSTTGYQHQGDGGYNVGVKYCPNCGAPNDPNAIYCFECGSNMDTLETYEKHIVKTSVNTNTVTPGNEFDKAIEDKRKINESQQSTQRRIDEKAKTADSQLSEEQTRERNSRKLRGKTNNDYLKSIEKTNKKIYDEIKGQLGGVGWNMAYVKALLEKHFGTSLGPDELPEEMEGSTRNVRKRRGFFGRIKDRVGGFFGGVGDRISGAIDWGKEKLGKAGEFIHGAIDFVTHPVQAIGGFFKFIGTNIWELIKTTGSMLAQVGKTIAKGVELAIEGIGGLVKSAAQGIGDAIGTIARTGATILSDVTLTVSSLLTGTIDYIGSKIPGALDFVFGAMGKLGRGLFKGAKAIGHGVAKGAKGVFNFIRERHHKRKARKEGRSIKDRINEIGMFQINGGFLDDVNHIDGRIAIDVGDDVTRVPFPYVNVINGIATSISGRAIPVYILGADRTASIRVYQSAAPDGSPASGDNAGMNMRLYQRTYSDLDRASEQNSAMAMQAADRAIARAQTPEELQAARDVQQLNQTQHMMALTGTVSDTGKNSDNDDGFLSTIMKLFLPNNDGGGGILSTILTALGGGGLLAGLKSIGSKLLGGLGNAGSTVLGGLGTLGSGIVQTVLPGVLPLMGAAQEFNKGEYLNAGFNAKRGQLRMAGGAVGFAQKLLKNPETAAKVPELIAKISEGLTNFVKSPIVAGVFKKLGKDPDAFVRTIESFIKNNIDNVASGTALAALKNATVVLAVAQAVYDFTIGVTNANNMYNVKASNVNFLMGVVGGLSNAISGLCFNLLSPEILANPIYEFLAGEEGVKELRAQQAAYKRDVVDVYNAKNQTNYSVEDFQKNFYDDGTKRKTGNWWVDLKNKWAHRGKAFMETITGKSSEPASDTGYGRGPGMRIFKQIDKRWNNEDPTMAATGCGPTAAAIVASAYGVKSDPLEADRMSYGMGMRSPDGGTNPAFFGQYAQAKSFGMSEGPVSGQSVGSNLASGRPVVLMGQGGAFGRNSHYLVGTSIDRTGGVNIVDPLTGGQRSVNGGNLLSNTTRAIYSYGKGNAIGTDGASVGGSVSSGGSSVRQAQNALVNAMYSIKGKIKYNCNDASKQDPDLGVASCASTVAWAYRKVLGFTPGGASFASSSGQSTDSNFVDVVRTGNPGAPGNKDFDLSLLQPGDIVYMYNTFRNGNGSNHTEMYVGNGRTMSHGGPDPGPQERELDAARRKKVWAVRRYRGFINGQTVNFTPFTGTVRSYNGTTSPATEATDSPKSALERVNSVFKNIGNNIASALDSVFNIFDPDSNQSENNQTNNTQNVKNSTIPATTKNFTPSGSSQDIWDYLISKGYNKTAAAGIMGCWQEESGNRSDRLEGDYMRAFPGFSNVTSSNSALNSYTENILWPALRNSGISISESGYTGDDGNRYPGFGLAQWTGPRAYNLLQYANERGLDWRDLSTQLQFFSKEAESNRTGGSVASMNQSTSVADATRRFLDGFEMGEGFSNKYPSWYNKRVGHANDIMAQFGAGPGFGDMGLWGTGTSAGTSAEAINDRIRHMNTMLTKVREEASSGSTVAEVTDRIAEAIETRPTTAGGDSEVLQVLTTSLAKMIELLSAIKDNTATGGRPTSKKEDTDNLPVVRQQVSNRAGSTASRHVDIGANVIDRLTSK